MQSHRRQERAVRVGIGRVGAGRFDDAASEHAHDRLEPVVHTDHAGETGRGIGVVAVERALGDPDLVAVFVDQAQRRMADRDLGMRVEGLDASGDVLRLADVVVRGPEEVLAAGMLEDPRVVPEDAQVGFVLVDADARVARGEGAAVFDRVVRRAVVADDQLEVLEGLREQGVQGGRQIGLAVVYGESDRDARRAGGGHRRGLQRAGWAGHGARSRPPGRNATPKVQGRSPTSESLVSRDEAALRHGDRLNRPGRFVDERRPTRDRCRARGIAVLVAAERESGPRNRGGVEKGSRFRCLGRFGRSWRSPWDGWDTPMWDIHSCSRCAGAPGRVWTPTTPRR